MSFVDEIDNFSPDEVREVMEKLCQLPPCPGQTMSMEEVVFWAGVAVGMQVSQHAEDGNVDSETQEKVLVFSSIFEHSTKNAIVDLALGEMDTPNPPTYQRTGSR
ncbi:MAG: hypothetical protein ACRD3P_00440 [Terriglobales bacterium]